MNVLVVTNEEVWNYRGKYTEDFMLSLIPNLFFKGLRHYMHLLRINRYGADCYGGVAEMDRIDYERRKEQFPWAFPDREALNG